jgi:uncharacterized protein (DUF2249 family)
MAKDWRKFTAAAELSRRLDKLEAALRRHKHDQEQRRFALLGGFDNAQVTHLPSGEPIGILIDDEPAPVRKKLTGKEWIEAELERSPELRAMSITKAGDELSKRSKNARDCAKSLSEGRCINLLRDCFYWPKKPRNSPKQRPK